jgi:putative spermidine/putrescine transport system substrate-binding protein
LLKTAAAVAGSAAGSGAITGFPVIWAQNIKDVVLRHAGAPVTVLPAIQEQVNKDLPFKVEMQASESVDLLNRFLSGSSAIDCADVSITFFKYLVGRDVLQAIPVSKFQHWDKTIPVFTTGTYPDGRKVSRQGTAPYSVLYATDAGGQKLHEGPTEWLTGVPTITNGDTLGIRPDLVGRKITTWADLLSPDFTGRAALQEQPTIGVMDTAMALEASGAIKYGDKGNMTKDEIDKTVKIMTEYKRAGQFRSFWSTFDQSVNLMASGEVVIQSMIAPAVTAVRSRGIPCTFQPLQEGYRGWAYSFGVMKHVTGLKLDCFYEYMNWYTSGFQGAFIAREGYYSAQPENARKFLTESEWGYWYGGAFWDRIGRIAAWNAVMDQDRYLTRRWNEFVTS